MAKKDLYKFAKKALAAYEKIREQSELDNRLKEQLAVATCEAQLMAMNEPLRSWSTNTPAVVCQGKGAALTRARRVGP